MFDALDSMASATASAVASRLILAFFLISFFHALVGQRTSGAIQSSFAPFHIVAYAHSDSYGYSHKNHAYSYHLPVHIHDK